MANAGNIVADGMRSYAERQVAMVRESMGHLWSELQSVGKQAPAAPTDQLERMRGAFEKVVAQVQELGQHMLEVQSQAMAVLNECAAKNLEVLGTDGARSWPPCSRRPRALSSRPSQQTSAVIDEMKRRMATLEHETQAAAARRAPPSRRRRSAPRPSLRLAGIQACRRQGRAGEGSRRRSGDDGRGRQAEGDAGRRSRSAAKPKPS